MTREPPGGTGGAPENGEGALGRWRVARAGSERAISASPLAPRARIAENVASRRATIEPGMAPGHSAGDDLDPVYSLPRSWPRVFPGL